jgi:hypothetical protein
MRGRGRALLGVVSFCWPALLVAPAGPSMSDSVLLAAIRLAEHGTWTLSDERDAKTVFLTEAYDISVHRGRIYSGVAPGASLVALPVYVALRPVLARFDRGAVANRRFQGYYAANSRGLSRPPAAHLRDVYLLQIALVWCVMAPLFASFLVRLRDRMREAGAAPAQATAIALAAGLGSIALYYSSMYSRQALAYLLAWHAILSLVAATPASAARHLVAGALLGLAVSIDYPSAILAGFVVAGLVPRLDPRGRLLVLGPVALACVLVALYHQSAFGSPLATPYHRRFWFTPDVLARQGLDLSAFQQGPALGIGLPSPLVMATLCFGTFKGLFVYCPVLLLGLVGHLAGLRTDRRRFHLASLLVFLAYLTFNAALGTQQPEYGRHFWGGLSVLWGPRYLLAAVPFLACGLLALDWGRAPIRIACGALLLVSCAMNVAGTMFSDVVLSTYAFGPDLEFPLAYVGRLLLAHGPRVPLLAAYGAPGWIQAALLAGVVAVSAMSLYRLHRPAVRE